VREGSEGSERRDGRLEEEGRGEKVKETREEGRKRGSEGSEGRDGFLPSLLFHPFPSVPSFPPFPSIKESFFLPPPISLSSGRLEEEGRGEKVKETQEEGRK
jgi:hypothetical protein